MSDSENPLLVSGGGSIAVSTTEMDAMADRLGRLAAAAEEWSAGVGTVLWLCDGDAETQLVAARRCCEDLAETGRSLRGKLDSAAFAYGLAERGAAVSQEAIGGLAGWLAGLSGRIALPAMLMLALPSAAGTALGLLLALGLLRLTGRSVDVPGTAFALRRLYNNPLTAQAVRVLISALDDGAAGAAGVPFPLARAFGEAGIGLTGPDTSAAGLLGLAGLMGVLRESPVSSRRVAGPQPAQSPPDGLEDLLARVPPPSDSAPEVRIERYDGAEGPAWTVYIGGTVSWDASGSTEPWDLTSNVELMADADPGSYRALVDAMQQAGIAPGDPVLAVGHSQGGMLAARLAADEHFTVSGVVTAGAPISGADLPAELPALRIEHSDDIVPALAGIQRDDPSEQHLLVRREAIVPGAVAAASFVPTHELAGYRSTAAAIDRAADPRLDALSARLRTGATQPPAEVSLWKGARDLSDDGRR